MTDLTVANTIRIQIGYKALFMLGATNLTEGENFLFFKIKGSKKANFVKITLDPTDTYTMTFSKARAGKMKVTDEVSGLFCDDMLDVIEHCTGLCVSL